MQGIHGWIEPFDIVFVAYCCRVFVPASVVFYITFHLLSDRGFQVIQVLAPECTECSVVLLFGHFFDVCFSVKALRTLGK